MNSSTSSGCEFYALLGGKPDLLSAATKATLLSTVVVNSVTFPFTILLNILVVIVVKTKARLQSKSNLLLACLAVTDVLVGIIVQPLNVATVITMLQDDTADAEYCWLQKLTQGLAKFSVGRLLFT